MAAVFVAGHRVVAGFRTSSCGVADSPECLGQGGGQPKNRHAYQVEEGVRLFWVHVTGQNQDQDRSRSEFQLAVKDLCKNFPEQAATTAWEPPVSAGVLAEAE